MDPNSKIFVTLELTVSEAEELVKILKPIQAAYDSSILGQVIEIAEMTTQLPSIIEQHDVLSDQDDDDDDDFDEGYELNPELLSFDGGFPQNWRYN